MKQISIVVAISVAVCLSIGTTGEDQDNIALECFASSTSCRSYEVIEDQSLTELKERVREGLERGGWRPEGGIVYSSETKCYLQVMVHPRKLESYP